MKFIGCVFLFHLVHSLSVFHQIPLIWPSFLSSLEFVLNFSLGVSTTTLDKICKHANKLCWTGLYDPNLFYPSKTWITSSCVGNLNSPLKDVPFYSHAPPPWFCLIKPRSFLNWVQLQIHFRWLPLPCLT